MTNVCQPYAPAGIALPHCNSPALQQQPCPTATVLPNRLPGLGTHHNAFFCSPCPHSVLEVVQFCRAAAEVLALADDQLPYSNSPALQAARLGLAHGRALHRGDARHAALFAGQLLGLADPTDSVCKTLRYVNQLFNRDSVAATATQAKAVQKLSWEIQSCMVSCDIY